MQKVKAKYSKVKGGQVTVINKFFCWGGHPKETAQGKVDGSFGANESVWPEDGQTSQAKENLKAVAVFDASESEGIFLILCR